MPKWHKFSPKCPTQCVAYSISCALSQVKPDAVIDFAANLDVGESQKEPEKYVMNNVVCFLVSMMMIQK